MGGLLDGLGDLPSVAADLPQLPDINPDGLLGAVDLGAPGADIDAWANGTHILSPPPAGSAQTGLLAAVPPPDIDVGPIDIPKFDFYPDRLETDKALLGEPHVQALMATIRDREGPQYNVIHGGQTFDDYSRHPKIKVDGSTAAGAYQFNYPTWTERQKAFGLPDFTPQSQDLAAVDLLHDLGATDRLLSGDVNGAIFAAGRRWASVPKTQTMNFQGNVQALDLQSKPTHTLEQIRADYLKKLR